MKRLVFVVDMVNGFVKFGAMADCKIAEIIPNIIEKIKSCDDVHFLCDNHDANDLELSFGYPLHCLENSDESKIVEELKIFANHKNVTFKKSTNAFFKLDKKILDYFDEFIITGCCTDICVLQFALTLKAYLNEFNINKRVIVPANCVETFNAPTHNREYYNEIALNLIKNAGAEVI